MEKASRPHHTGEGGSTNTTNEGTNQVTPFRYVMRYQRIAPHHHIKGKLLDALAVALLFVFTSAMGVICLLLSVRG